MFFLNIAGITRLTSHPTGRVKNTRSKFKGNFVAPAGEVLFSTAKKVPFLRV